jgi:hypothetical protein
MAPPPKPRPTRPHGGAAALPTKKRPVKPVAASGGRIQPKTHKKPHKPPAPSPAQYVTLTSTRFGQRSVRALLDADPPLMSAGYGNFDEITRPGRRSLVSWTGSPARRLTLALMIDAWGNGNVVNAVGTLEYMATGDTFLAPPLLHVTGAAMPHPEIRWYIADIAWGASLRDASGLLVRQQVSLTLIEGAVVRIPVKRPSSQQGQTVKLPSPGGSVAVARLAKAHGTTSQAIVKLNGYRTAATIKTGTRLRLPA